MELTRAERWMLSNQLRILEKLHPEDAKYLEHDRKGIEDGYELHYGDAARHIDEDELSADKCQEVLQILAMYRALTFSYRDLADKSGIDEKEIAFDGFDGNEEGKWYGYVDWFCKDGGKFTELWKEGDDFNSHAPRLDVYRRMIDEWGSLPEERRYLNKLSKDEIIRITKARIHPSNR